jgi:hypothetical protein
MMTKIQTALSCLVAISALGMIAAGTAAGDEYLILGKAVPAGGAAFVSENINGASKLISTGLEVTCPQVFGSGLLLPEGKSDALIVFEGSSTEKCEVKKPEHCAVKEPFDISATDELILESGLLFDKFNSTKTKKLLTTLLFSNSGGTCAVASVEVKGTARAEVPEQTKEALAHVLKFTATSGSELEAGGVASTFTLEDLVCLEDDDRWSVS